MELKIKELDVNIIAPNEQTMHRSEQGGSKIVIIGKPGCFARGTRILTWGGKKVGVEHLTPRHVLVGWDGAPRYIRWMCRGTDTMYTIRYGKHGRVVVNSRHILTLYDTIHHTVRDIPVFELKTCHVDHFLWMRYKNKKLVFEPFSVSFSGEDAYFGFEVYGPDHHFLLGDYSIVHNTGKCFARNTRILLMDMTIKNVQDVVVGDVLCGDDGTERRVLSVTQGRDKMFQVRQSVGTDYIVNSEHILCLQSFHLGTQMEIQCRQAFDDQENILRNYGGMKRLSTSPYPITITKYAEDDEYFGFEITGNGRFCLEDGTITHNTTLITSLLYEKRHIFPVAFIMSGTEDSNGHYKKLVPSTFVYNKLQEKKIEDFVTRQKIAKKHLSNPWAVLLLDDCTDDPKLFNKPLFQGLYKNGRHWKMWFILSLQYCMDIKPVIRTNIDGVFILRETNLRNRKSLWENYAGIIPDFTMFCHIMDQITDNYTALYIHNATTSNNLEDCLFWYKAKHVPSDFRFGSKDLWKFHYNRYNDNYSDPFV